MVVVDIDEKSLNALGQWPWPRIVLANVLKKIYSYAPSAIGMDIMFSEEDRTSPKQINLFYKKFFDAQTSFYGIPDSFLDNDIIFSEAIQDTKSVIGIYLSKDATTKKTCNPLNPLEINASLFELNSFDHLLCNIPSLKSTSKYSGFVNAIVDEDAILRRMPLMREYNGIVIPSLALATLLSINDEYNVSKNSVSVLGHKVQTDNKSNVLLNFYPNEWYKKIPIIDLLNNNVPKNLLMGKVVLLGSSATSLHDNLIVSGGEKIIGVKVHVTMIDNILNNEYMTQPTFYKPLNVFLSLVLSLIFFVLFSKGHKKSVIFLFLLSVVTLIASVYYTFGANIYISLAYFLIPFVVYFFLISITHIVIDTYDKHLLKEELTKKHIQELDGKVKDRTAKLVKSHKHIKDNIDYAAIIQNAILPTPQILSKYVEDAFVFWRPRDVVGGDIYFISELSSKEEILVMVIDGAGHGVSGAFVTMLVKAIEAQILTEIESSKMPPSPALILEYFNRSIKLMLKQDKKSKSNAGFDGGVLYLNKRTGVCKYAGAKTPLYIMKNGVLQIIQSDKKNVGYIRTKIEQKYTEYEIEIDKGTLLYITTDGYIDQEGEDNTRYNKKLFKNLLQKIHTKPLSEQKDDIIFTLEAFQSTTKQSDDITVMGLKF